MRDVAERVLAATRRRWFKARPLFVPYEPATHLTLSQVEERVAVSIPEDLKQWLLCVGFGDVDESLSFRKEYFSRVEYGHLKGAVIFAQDELGNFYAYSSPASNVVFFSRSSPKCAVAAPSFRAFMEDLERRDFKLEEWMESLPCEPYAWDA